MAKRTRLPKGPQPLGVCRTSVGLALGLLIGYGFGVMAAIALNSPTLGQWMMLVWSLTLLAMGFAVFCLYRHQRVVRWAVVAVLLVLASLLTSYPVLSPFWIYTLQALGVVGFSLVMYDVGKLLRQPLGTGSGLIFLAIISTILNSPLAAFIGMVLMILGAYLLLQRLGLMPRKA
ncbi:MAG: hypothetical protein GXO36_07305 [Chloroflexi bacterium]|nr:hypothetical protein [Chloroflexota bacterium]